MNNWQPYPQNSPAGTDEAKLKDYVVLVPNPHRIEKSGFSTAAPRYQVCLAFWMGDRFVNEHIDELNVHYYLALPSHS